MNEVAYRKLYVHVSKLQPTRCNVSWFIYFYRCSTCFRWFLRSSSGAHNCTYSFRYCQPILLPAAIVDENSVEFYLIHDSIRQQYWLTIPEALCTVLCSWWWAEEPPERASVEIINQETLHLVGYNLEIYLPCMDIWMSKLYVHGLFR